jgi:uncharacterized membrane protein
MIPEELEKRLGAIEQRLARIEARLFATPAGSPPKPAPIAAPPRPAPIAVPVTPSEERPSLVTSVLGWGGAIALVLAAAYLIRLAIDTGWLTPMRQVALAVIGGFVLIGAGFALREVNRQYAGLLPAGGIAILFLSTYSAHLYYGLFGAAPAAAAVIGICIGSLWLCRVFRSDLYALFAVAGSYSAPFLLSSLRGSITDLVIYFSAWSVVFSAYAVWHGRRLIYLLAMYLALVGFDIIWRNRAPAEWIHALVFQTVQFAIFGVATAVYSIHHREPLDTRSGLAHLPPLLLFYFLQYALLSRHLPAAAPWIAVGSAAVVAMLYTTARTTLDRPLPGGELLLWSYAALVLFHAGYLESVPKQWAPWVAFVLLPILGLMRLRRASGGGAGWPIWLAVGLIFLVNYLRVILDTDVQGVPARPALAVAYALELYAAYYFVRSKEQFALVAVFVLYAGHISAMAAALHLLDTRIVESTAWALLALACLGLAWWQRDRLLGRSSLLLFGATAAKVLLYDLSGAPPVARIISLVVLGAAFYAGGLLYERIDRAAAK